MARALEPDNRLAVALHHEDGAALGRVGLASFGSGTQIVWNCDRTRCLVMEGELYDTTVAVQMLGKPAAPDSASSDAAIVLGMFERFGSEGLAKLNGAFVVAIWDARARELVLFNDRLGLFPLYYTETSAGLLFASGVRALLADPAVDRTVDPVAIGQFVVYDHLLDDRTLLKGSRLLPQGAVLTYRDGRSTIGRYWTLQYPELYEPQPEAAYIEQFIHVLRQAVKRQHPGGLSATMLLSGGLDSRLLLALIGEMNAGVSSLTFGIPGCDDARVAAEVASVVGVPHRFVELKPDWLLTHAEEAVRVTDGMGNVINMHALAPSAASGAQVLFKGFLGDALLGFALKRSMWGDYSREASYQVHLGAHREHGVINYEAPMLARLFTDSFQKQVGDSTWRTYQHGMDRAGVAQLGNQRLYFDLTQRVPRMTLNGVEVARRQGIVRLPFGDNDLLDFALTVPPGLLFERHLPKAALITHFPTLARVPIAGTGRPLAACFRDVAVQFRDVMAWHFQRAGVGRLIERRRRPYKDYNGWFRTLLRPWVEETLLRPQALGRGYFNPDFVRGLVAEHMAGTNHGVRIGALMTLELWHRQNLD